MEFEAATMDSGVPAKVVPRLVELKTALAEATDAELACASVAEPVMKVQERLRVFLREAAPGMAVPQGDEDGDEFKPAKGLFGNEVTAKVSLFAGPPRLLEVILTSDVTCGQDSQLLIYEERDGHWRRGLRWSADFGGGAGSGRGYTASFGAAWGDFFLTSVLVPDAARPDQWRAVVAHGTPWCSSRFSAFGLAVLAPASNGAARVAWQTDRAFSRGDYDVRLKGSSNVFEFRVNADEMSFDMDDAFERLVVYRYRVTGDAVTRLEPVAGNARGFVEEWLSMPWEEALAQSDDVRDATIKQVHDEFARDVRQTEEPTDWRSGAVQACSAKDRFQVTMRVEKTHYAPAKAGERSTPVTTLQRRYYFQLRESDGYHLLRVTAAPDPGCGGPDLMKK